MRVATPEEVEDEAVVGPAAEVAVVPPERNATTVERWGTWPERVGHPEVVPRDKVHIMEIAPVEETTATTIVFPESMRLEFATLLVPANHANVSSRVDKR